PAGPGPGPAAPGPGPAGPGPGPVDPGPGPDPGPPAQRVRVVTPQGDTVVLAGDQEVVTEITFVQYRPEPVALDTGSAVGLSVEGGVCSDIGDGSFQLDGGVGDTCVLRVVAAGDASHAALDARLTIRFRAGQHLSWRVTAEPESPGCYAPGQVVGDLVLAVAGGTTTLRDLQVVRNDPELRWDRAAEDDETVVRVTVRVADDAAPGRYDLRLGYSIGGGTLTSSDAPTDRDYRVGDPTEVPPCASTP
uniref:hypothetical protein n=1 Tax=Cellulomonas endophytica TaxID=2494735 RepID=UPI00196A5A0A